MALENIILPELGESVTEAKVLKIHKKIGDSIHKNEVIAEVATDKVDSEIESSVEGVVMHIACEEGDTVAVGAPILSVQVGGDTVVSAEQNPPLVATNAMPQEVVAQKSADHTLRVQDIFLSPLVKNMVIEHAITEQELDSIEGTGLNGRISKQDILTFLAHRKLVPKVSLDNDMGSSSSSPSTSATFYKNSFANIDAASYGELFPTESKNAVEIIEMTRMRSIISGHMRNSLDTSAHSTLFAEADVTDIVVWREKNKKIFAENHHQKLTYTHIMVRAVALILQQFPFLNSSVDGNKIILKKDINLGIATALSSGDLIVPVIKNADLLSFPHLVKKVNETVEKARANRLKLTDIEGGTFTISNIGNFNGLHGTPILQQPQVALLVIGAIKKKPAVKRYGNDYIIVPRDILHLSLGFDHRIIDGMLAGSFLNAFIQHLELFEPPV